MLGRVLVVDDDVESCEMLEEGLRLRGFEVRSRQSVDDALRAIGTEGPFDAVLTDLRMPQRTGLDLLRHVVATEPALPVIVVTAFGSIDMAVQAVRLGAHDFITKPFDLDVIAIALERAVQYRSMRLAIDRLRARTGETTAFGAMIGESTVMRRVHDVIERVAGLDATVLVTGESGTGKELAARALHALSPRAARPFVAVNCAAIPEQLLESELFGHVKGAFTDARSDRVGLMTRAAGGTLFLDEIGDMTPPMQAKLLRVLQERTIRPVGSNDEIPFEGRVVAATHQDLESLVANGRFRQDLYFRVNVIEITMPPLRMRGRDVLALAESYFAVLAERAGRAAPRLTPEAAERLLAYAWPGNVRELHNCIERVFALCPGDEVRVADLPPRLETPTTDRIVIDAGDPSELVPLEEIERQYILRVLQATGGNKKLAAQVLGLDRSTLYRKLERFERPTST